MSESIDTIRADLWEKMRGGKSGREAFVATHLSANIAAQIQTIREQRGWTKKELAERAGMAPSRISVMEDPSYEKYALTTLRRLASTFDVALITRFIPFSELVDWVADLSPEKMGAEPFERDHLLQQNTERVDRESEAGQSKYVTILEFGSTESMRQKYPGTDVPLEPLWGQEKIGQGGHDLFEPYRISTSLEQGV